jgi:hypothetical protein
MRRSPHDGLAAHGGGRRVRALDAATRDISCVLRERRVVPPHAER